MVYSDAKPIATPGSSTTTTVLPSGNARVR